MAQIDDAEFVPHPLEAVRRHRICRVWLPGRLIFEIFEPFGDLLSASGRFCGLTRRLISEHSTG
ncbi:hypothetical protein [Rhizobium leguminosarum]|uniref:hypothetical protein n=1 Tax=Rhizobium leguminosarum TaxID=384 RepID=UPI001FEE80D7|nr:hypothetical protein [Rhizobium leguminosarum]